MDLGPGEYQALLAAIQIYELVDQSQKLQSVHFRSIELSILDLTSMGSSRYVMHYVS